jgi:hypothetical protein
MMSGEQYPHHKHPHVGDRHDRPSLAGVHFVSARAIVDPTPLCADGTV